MSSVVVHYGELALKGRNRSWFIQMLVRNIKAALADMPAVKAQPLVGRIIVTLRDEDAPEAARRLQCVPGIVNLGVSKRVPATLDAMIEAALEAVRGRSIRSFRVVARRADKRFPIESPEIEKAVGASVKAATGWAVSLSAPELVIRLDVLTQDAFLFLDRLPGSGGLPVGTGGKVMALMSGGIDSPVAAWRVIRRGCRAHFVHFHSYPVLSNASQQKARDLVRTLTRYQMAARLYLVPFGGIQQKILVSIAPPLRVVLYRRMMLRIAEELAVRAGAKALVTGDAVGQVASQTIENLAVVGRVATLPVLRPLVGMDKEEITRDALRIGTYETSILPDEDCCTLFTPRYPATAAGLAEVEQAEGALDVAGLVRQAVQEARLERFRYPALLQPAAPV